MNSAAPFLRILTDNGMLFSILDDNEQLVIALVTPAQVAIRNGSKQKSPAENRGAFDLDIVNEDVPSLADLAATYSSKP